MTAIRMFVKVANGKDVHRRENRSSVNARRTRLATPASVLRESRKPRIEGLDVPLVRKFSHHPCSPGTAHPQPQIDIPKFDEPLGDGRVIQVGDQKARLSVRDDLGGPAGADTHHG
jgi:hypothetical protein